jgi:ribonuclease P protein component
MTGSPADRLFFLRNSAGIERVKKSGRRFQTPLFNLVSSASDGPHTRIGIIVGRRFGGAVARNRVKRVFRALARQVRQDLVQGYDMLIFPRREALSAKHAGLKEAWVAALRHEGLLIAHVDRACNESVLG